MSTRTPYRFIASARWGWCGVLVLFLLSTADVVAQEPEEPATRQVTILNVDHLEQVLEDGEIVRRLTGNVYLQQDSTYLQSDRAIQYLERDEIYFYGRVVITDRGDSLRADTVFYNQRTKVGEAQGQVEFFDGEVRVLAPSAWHHTDDKRTQFTEGVMLVDSLTTLTSWEGEYFSEEKRAEFAHDIRLHRPWSYLESDSITYYRETDISLARGNVLIERWEETEEGVPPDSVSRTLLLGERAYNDEHAGISRMQGRSLVMQLEFDHETADIDTLIMRSDRLEAVEQDDQRRIIAVGDVRSWRKAFAAVADSVVYDRYHQQLGPLETEDPPPLIADAEWSSPGTQTASRESLDIEPITELSLTGADSLIVPAPPGGSSEQQSPADTVLISVGVLPPAEMHSEPEQIAPEQWLFPRLGEMLSEYRFDLSWDDDIVAEEDTVEEVRLFRDPIAWFEESQVTADSIRVRTDSTPVDSIFARGQVFIAQLDTLSQRINQLKGRNLAGTSVDDSLRTFAVGPNAEAIYHRSNEADEPDGAVQALGDESLFRFFGEDLEYLHFTGGIEGYYYEEEQLTQPLELDGYIWVPERRPQKDDLLMFDPLQYERIVRLLTTYPPLPERVPEAPPDREPVTQPPLELEAPLETETGGEDIDLAPPDTVLPDSLTTKQHG